MGKQNSSAPSIKRYFKVDYSLKSALTSLRVAYDDQGTMTRTGSIKKPLSKNARLVFLSVGFFIHHQNSNTTDFCIHELTEITGLGRTAIIQAIKELKQVALLKETNPETSAPGFQKQYEARHIYNGIREKEDSTVQVVRVKKDRPTMATTLPRSSGEPVPRSPHEPPVSLLYKQDNSKQNYPLSKQPLTERRPDFFNLFLNLEPWKKTLTEDYYQLQISQGVTIRSKSALLEKIVTNNELFDSWQDLSRIVSEMKHKADTQHKKKQTAKVELDAVLAAFADA